MANTVTVRVTAPGAKQAAGDVDGLRSKFENLQKTGAKGFMIGAGAAATTMALNAVGNAAHQVGELIGNAINDASAMSESVSKIGAVFGDSGEAMLEWAQDSATAFGMSKQQALEAAGTYGNLFQAFGVGQTEAAGMSQSLVELAADMASFNNTSIDDALTALRSGLSGETEPLKRYGIAISDARMRTALAEKGFKNLGATLTPLQKTTAAYALIMKDSALAQGDFARTSDGLANSQRILDAQLADLSAEFGEVLLPAMTEFVNFLVDDAVPAVRHFGDVWNDVIKTLSHQWPKDRGPGPLGREILALRNAVYADWPEHGALFAAMRRLQQSTEAAAAAAREDLLEALVRLGPEFGLTEASADALAERFGLTADEVRAAWATASEAFAADAARIREALSSLGPDFEMTEDAAREWAQVLGVTADDVKRIFGRMRGRVVDDVGGMITDIVDEVRGSKDVVEDAMSDLAFAMDKPLKLQREISRVEGALMGEKLAAGLASSNPFIRQAAIDARDALVAQWEKLTGLAYREGVSAADAMERGLKTFNPSKWFLPRIGGGGGTSGGRARGGPVNKGEAYIVGEERAELFVPDSNGTILPSVPTRMGGSQTLNITLRNEVRISSRDVRDSLSHHAVVQAGGPAFR